MVIEIVYTSHKYKNINYFYIYFYLLFFISTIRQFIYYTL